MDWSDREGWLSTELLNTRAAGAVQLLSYEPEGQPFRGCKSAKDPLTSVHLIYFTSAEDTTLRT